MSGKFDRGYRKNKLKNITKLALGDQHGIFQHFQSDVTDYPSRERYLSMRGGESTSRDRLYGIGPEHEDSYVPLEHTARSLSTRYSPNRCGVQAMRVPGSNGGVFQDPYTKKIYDYNEGFTLEDGTSFPGGSPALQTSLMGFANHLDELGLYKEANYLDSLIKRAGDRADALSTEEIVKLVDFLKAQKRPLSDLANVDSKTPWVMDALNPVSEEESLDPFDMITGEHNASPEGPLASEDGIISKLIGAMNVMQGEGGAADVMRRLDAIKERLQSDSEKDMESAGWMAHHMLQGVTRTGGGRLNAFMLMLNLFLMWGGELAHDFFKSRMEDIEAEFQEEGRSWFKKSESLSKNVLEHMIKFASYLDFHGFCNEADYLDLLLKKNAQEEAEPQYCLTEVANSLDNRGLYREADFLDASIKRAQAAASLSS